MSQDSRVRLLIRHSLIGNLGAFTAILARVVHHDTGHSGVRGSFRAEYWLKRHKAHGAFTFMWEQHHVSTGRLKRVIPGRAVVRVVWRTSEVLTLLESTTQLDDPDQLWQGRGRWCCRCHFDCRFCWYLWSLGVMEDYLAY